MVEVFKEFTAQRRSYVIVNGNPETIPAMYAAHTYKVPGLHDVREPNGQADDVHSLVMDGELVPGTLVFRDLYKEEMGNRRLILDAAQAVRTILGIDQSTGRANSRVYDKGLTLLPSSVTTREELEEVREAAKKRALKWRIDQAREIVKAVDDRNFKLERQGLPVMPGGPEYRSALMLLKTEAEQEQALSNAILGIEPVAAPAPRPTDTETDEILEFIKSKIEAAAPEKTTDEKSVLVEKILRDPEALKMMDKLRKRRAAFGPGAGL